MTPESVDHFLYTWNQTPPDCLKHTQIEDDIRDSMQAAFIRRPSLTERKELLELSAKVGTHTSTLGYPAISQKEYEDCGELLHYIQYHKLGVEPSFLSRVLIKDLEPIVALNNAADLKVRAEMFLGTSLIRRKVEGWDLEKMLERLVQAGRYLSAHKLRIGFSIEDGTRTPPDDLEKVINAALEAEVDVITICDTVGECTPTGAAQITEFVANKISRAGANVEIAWHGHNDKGLSVANALASAMAGACAISGTFMGIGERSGNTPLEQVVMLLHQAGNERYNLKYLQPYCRKISEYTEIPIIPTSPLVGKQAFATSAGTHSAAILKSRTLGADFEDYIFSSVPASKLGRTQDVIIGPTSGTANASYMLAQMGISTPESLAPQLLAYAKSKDRWLSSDDIRQYINQFTSLELV